MDLWIRSQNKETLVKCNDISITLCNRIVGYFDKVTEYETLGEYETKERAIEVLDEIQLLLMPRAVFKPNEQWRTINPYLTEIYQYDNSIEYQDIGSCVYQMPAK